MKRGESGLSFVFGVNKPAGISSHDVVQQVRRLTGERRVGHFGTLDPFATGVLPVAVGSATRLDAYLTEHGKTYRAQIIFGTQTTTYDKDGEPLLRAVVPSVVRDREYAQEVLKCFTGVLEQIPPQYSAIKVNGVKACDNARMGGTLNLMPRQIEVYSSVLEEIGESESGEVFWTVSFSVSKGAYIRSLAHDIGIACGCGAYLNSLNRLRFGNLDIGNCVSLDGLSRIPEGVILDPVRLLDVPLVFLSAEEELKVVNGNALGLTGKNYYRLADCGSRDCCRTSGACSVEDPKEGDLVALVSPKGLSALYRRKGSALHCACGFHPEVSRG